MFKPCLSSVKRIKRTKSNSWFIEKFLPSFKNCYHKQISEKQGKIFEKYLEEDPNNWKHANASYYKGIADGLYIRLQVSGAYNGTAYTSTGRKTLYRAVYALTVTEDQTEKEILIHQELEAIGKKIDVICGEDPDNPLIDAEEEKETDLYNQLSEITKKYF